jgi:hypothetical protein
MYFNLRKINEPHNVSDNLYFSVPHRLRPMSAKKLGEQLCPPEPGENYSYKLKEIFNGETIENTLSIYYKKAPKPIKNQEQEHHEWFQGADYVFIGPEEEDEFAELMGVELYDEYKEKNKNKAKKVTSEDIALFREYINDIREGIKNVGLFK